MRINLMRLLAVVTILLGVVSDATSQQSGGVAPSFKEKEAAQVKRPPPFTLTSPAFSDLGTLPLKYTQAGGKAITPPLEWTNVPERTAAFVLTFKDPDAAMNGNPEDALIWMVVNIPGNVRSLLEGIPPGPTSLLPEGATQSSWRTNGYIGPGAGLSIKPDHYTFELFALSSKLDVPANATRPQVLQAMAGKVIGKKAVLIAMCCQGSK